MDKLDQKVSMESCDLTSMAEKEYLSFALQKIHVSESNVDENVNNLDVNPNADCKESYKRYYPVDKSKYKELRRWKNTGKGY